MKHNYQDKNMAFLKEKINDIKVAIFKSEINSDLRLPNNIIQILKVDDDGTVWFFTSCNGKHAQSIDKSFYGYLDFHKKGTGCQLHLNGKVSIVENDDENLLSVSNYSTGTLDRLILVKMKIMQAEYMEIGLPDNVTWTEKLKSTFQQIFFPQQQKVYHFS